MSANAWICALPPIIALDLWFAYSVITRRQPPSWITTALAAMVGLAAVSFYLINTLYIFPTIEIGNLLPMLGWSLVAAFIACWIGETVGDYLGLQNKQVEEAYQIEWQLRFVPPVAFVVLVGFIILFITTASPPV